MVDKSSSTTKSYNAELRKLWASLRADRKRQELAGRREYAARTQYRQPCGGGYRIVRKSVEEG